MKTRELIRRLQEADPSGDIEVCVGKYDIHFLTKVQAYYDGAHTILVRDESKSGYNITGAIINRFGEKINLHLLSAQDVIDDDPEAPIEVRGGDPEQMKAMIKSWRVESRRDNQEVEEWAEGRRNDR